MVAILLQYLGCLALLLQIVAGVAIDYCASNNLGVDNTNYMYMSNGYCKDYCMQNGYAVAITQYLNCWCSNYVPGDTVSNSDCSTNCPGFPSEKCGGDGLYGYVIVGDVSGTQDSSTPTSTTSTTSSPRTSSTPSPTTTSTTSPPTTSSTPTTTSTSQSPEVATLTTQIRVTNQVSETVKVTQTYMVTTAAVNSSPSQSSSSSSSSSSQSSFASHSSSEDSSESMRATTIYSIKTVNGSEQTQLVRTEYVTTVPSPTSSPDASSSATASSSPSSEDKSSNSFFDSKGKVAGTFTAVGVVVLGLVSGILYCCCCCGGGKHDDDFTDEENQYSSDELSIEKPTVPATFYNNQSKNSSPQLSSNLKRNSSSKSILSLFSPSNNSNVGVGRTPSKKKLNPSKHIRSDSNNNDGGLMFPISEFDTRLDPNSMFLNTNESTKTLGDDLDYSRRMLHITNPE